MEIEGSFTCAGLVICNRIHSRMNELIHCCVVMTMLTRPRPTWVIIVQTLFALFNCSTNWIHLLAQYCVCFSLPLVRYLTLLSSQIFDLSIFPIFHRKKTSSRVLGICDELKYHCHFLNWWLHRNHRLQIASTFNRQQTKRNIQSVSFNLRF